MLRVCHLNRCSVGVATQDEKLREHFVGTVDKLINFFTLLAEDVREILAHLGYTHMEEIIGRSDLLSVIDDAFAKKFDFSSVLMRLEGPDTHNGKPDVTFDKNEFEKDILKDIYKVIENPDEKIVLHKNICNTNRSFGTLISGEIAKFYGNKINAPKHAKSGTARRAWTCSSRCYRATHCRRSTTRWCSN